MNSSAPTHLPDGFLCAPHCSQLLFTHQVFGPGGKLHPQYFLEHKGHLVIEALLLATILYLFLQHSFKPRPKAEAPLTDKVRKRERKELDRKQGGRSRGVQQIRRRWVSPLFNTFSTASSPGQEEGGGQGGETGKKACV